MDESAITPEPNTAPGEPLAGESSGAGDELCPEKIFQNAPEGAADSEAEAGADQSSRSRRYRRTMVFYGEQFECSSRTVKRWVAVGKKANDLPPLDEPEKMAEWWSRNMDQRPPAKLLLFSVPATVEPVVAALPGPVAAVAVPSVREASPGAIGMLAALERLRLAEEKAGRAYAEALAEDPPDPGRIEMRQRAWERLSEALRKAEKDAGKILVDSGELMPTEEVRQVVREIFGPLFQTWRQFIRRVRPLLSGKNQGEQDLIWDQESDRQFLEFQRHPFFGEV